MSSAVYHPTLAALLLALGLITASSNASAQSCEALPGSFLESFPASGSRQVPRNGVAKVVYCPTDDPVVDRTEARLYLDHGSSGDGCDCPEGSDCLDVGFQSRCLEPIETTAELDGDSLWIRTLNDEPLLPSQAYVLEAPDPSGPVRLSFSTGEVIDSSPPVFRGIQELDIFGCGPGFPAHAACPVQLDEEGFIVIVKAEAASDDAGLVNIEYRALQDRGDELVERGRVRGDGVNDVTVTVFVPGSELSDAEWERLCFTMVALDPYGFESGPSGQICEFTPEFSPFASLCSVSSRPSDGLGLALPLFALLLLSAIRASLARSRRRSARRPL